MKQSYLYLFLVLLLFSSCDKFDAVEPSGNIVTKSITDLFSFSKLSIAGGIVADVTEGDESKIIIEADDNVMPYIEVNRDEDCLGISFSNSISKKEYIKDANISVHIISPNVKQIRDILAKGTATIDIPTTIQSDSLAIHLSSESQLTLYSESRKISGNLSSSSSMKLQCSSSVVILEGSSESQISLSGICQDSLNVTCSSAAHSNINCDAKVSRVTCSSKGNVTAEGECSKLLANATSSGTINAQKYKVNTAIVSAKSKAKVDVNVLDKFVGDAHSNATITVLGTPKEVSKSEESDGKIIMN